MAFTGSDSNMSMIMIMRNHIMENLIVRRSSSSPRDDYIRLSDIYARDSEVGVLSVVFLQF